MKPRDALDRNCYVAHHTFKNGANCDDRAMRRCPRCGGVQYDWGGAPYVRGGRRRYFMNWYCNGRGACGLMSEEWMSERRFNALRQHPPKIARAPSAPWKRWRDMQQRDAA